MRSRVHPGWTASAGLLVALGCGDDLPTEPPAPPVTVVAPIAATELARSATYLMGLFGGSSVYLGDGWVLSNWHVAVNSAMFNVVTEHDFGVSVPREDYLTDYLRGAGNALPIEGAISADDVYCVTASTATVAARYERFDGPAFDPGSLDRERTFCAPVLETPLQHLGFSWIPPPGPDVEARLPRPELEWATMSLDVSVARVEPEAVRAYVGDMPRVPIGFDAPLTRGQLVWVIGYPATVLSRPPYRAVVELCQIVEPEVRDVADPDRIQPSLLVVPSFVIDCVSLEPGSSGSPVFDAQTGAVLGLVWTADEFGYGYVSAARAWKAWAEARPGAPEAGALRALMARDP